MSTVRVFPSLIAANLLDLRHTVKELDSHCDGFHIDIMDNHFVPNLTLGPMFANEIDNLATQPSWLHLMIECPEAMIPQFKIKKQSIISFHLEATTNIKKTVELIQKQEWVASIAIKPSTPLKHLYPYLPFVQHVLLMSVEPGFSGQPFIHESLNRLKQLVEHRTHQKLTYAIGMDGGITINTIGDCAAHGATDFAIASAIFSQNNAVRAIENLYKKIIH